jgi:hypothetical protein
MYDEPSFRKLIGCSTKLGLYLSDLNRYEFPLRTLGVGHKTKFYGKRFSGFGGERDKRHTKGHDLPVMNYFRS